MTRAEEIAQWMREIAAEIAAMPPPPKRGRPVKPCAKPWDADHPATKAWARRQTRNALRSGLIKPGTCEDCGSAKVEAHHLDYGKPELIAWLCRPCHRARHIAK